MLSPRVELMDSVKPYSASVAGLLAKKMHDEDSKFGVSVSNHQNNYWVAYGDDGLFLDTAKKQLSIILQTSQASADEVINAFLYKKYYLINQYRALRLIPMLRYIQISNTKLPLESIYSPLFVTKSPSNNSMAAARGDISV